MNRAGKCPLPPWHYLVPHLIHQIAKLLERPCCEEKNSQTHCLQKQMIVKSNCMHAFFHPTYVDETPIYH
jgi:hypothetical protein